MTNQRIAPVTHITTGRLTQRSQSLLAALDRHRIMASATVRSGAVTLELRGDPKRLLELIELWTDATPPDPPEEA